MKTPEPLRASALYHGCDPRGLGFSSTSELKDLDRPPGQDRLLEALKFGVDMRSRGFNLFVLGPQGADRRALVERFLEARAAQASTPQDCCYLYNFDEPNQPRLLLLPSGHATSLRDDLRKLVDELRTVIPATFESDEYQSRLQELQQEFAQRQQQAFQELNEEASREHIALISTPHGFTFAPMKNSREVMEPQEFERLPDRKKERIQETVEKLEKRLQEIIKQFPRWRREVQEKVHALNEEMVGIAVGQVMDELHQRYAELPEVCAHLNAIRRDVVENAAAFHGGHGGEGSGRARQNPVEQLLARYHANVMIDHGETQGAPVVYEDLPSHQHLLGRVEHHVVHGALITDYSLIRPGALHRANGGYLILDARRLLTQPLAWETLKRTLAAGEIRTESIDQMYGFLSTVALEPEPVPLDVKVILLGERFLYYLLSAHDPDFADLFKVQADFEDELPRDSDAQHEYARMLATIIRRDKLRPLDAGAVARVIEHGSRLAGDREKVTAENRAIADLLHEASHWAGADEQDTVSAEHVRQAIDSRERRASRLRERSREMVLREVLYIDTDGQAVGQINGLSVLQLGDFAFGRPTRITATARAGRGQVVDIEREAKLGGSTHTKGVMILSRLLASRYAPEGRFSLSASLAFEQSYGPIDGDSASVAELCALLSAIAGVPLRQALAVTGSINQHGEVQPVGGVNEKIEGFFDICSQRGFAEHQGVLVPAANVTHLMLREEVRNAVEEGHFRIYPLRDIHQAIALLTGMDPGEPDEAGRFPEGSFNRKVRDRLEAFSASLSEGVGDSNGARYNGGERNE